jgi:hypothetical protein
MDCSNETSDSVAPPGLSTFLRGNPGLKPWAILGRPFGTSIGMPQRWCNSRWVVPLPVRLHVEAEFHYVAVLDDVFLALDAEAAGFAGFGE